MLKRVHITNFLVIRSIFINTKVHYRIKCNINVEDVKALDENFIKKLLTGHKQSNTHLILKECLQSLESLKYMGFHTYQLVEYPKLLKLNADELNRRYALVTSTCDKSHITLEMLKVASAKSPTKKLNDIIKEQLENKSTSKSYTETLRETLKCTEIEMLELFIKNPRLGGQKKQSNLIPKIKLLLDNGALLEHIKSNTSLLNNVPLNVLEKRVQRLNDIGYNKPLPIAFLGRTETIFEEKVNKLIQNEKNIEKVRNNLAILNKISLFKEKNLYRHIDKVEYLLSKGYKDTDIIQSPKILIHSLSKIKTAVEHFEKFHLNLVPLALCHNYTNKRSMVLVKRQKCKNKIFSIIDPEGEYSHSLKLPNEFKSHTFDDVSLYKSLNYLLTLGFTKHHIIRVPLIICYNSSVLQQIWEDLTHSEVDYIEKFSSQRIKLLNIMQYKLEKLKLIHPAEMPSLTDACYNNDYGMDDQVHPHYDKIKEYHDGGYSEKIKVNNSIDYEESDYENEHFYKSFNVRC